MRSSLLKLPVAVVLLTTPCIASITVLNDGGMHSFPPLVGEEVQVLDGPMSSTAVKVLAGGTINASLVSFQNSEVDLLGGLIGNDLVALDSSVVRVSGGIIGRDLAVGGNSVVALSGGSINRWLSVDGNSSVTVSGGEIGSHLWSNGNKKLSITGGAIGESLFVSNSTVELSGGSIGSDLAVEQGGQINVFGIGFFVDGQAVPFGTTLTSADHLRILSGVLESGDLLSNRLQIQDNSIIVLQRHIIPEPSTITIWSVLALGAVWQRKRQSR